MAHGAQGRQLLAYLSRLPQDKRRFIPPLHALFCRWGGVTWGYMENLPERPRIWTGWLQKGCFSQTSTQPTHCAHHVSWGWPMGTRSRDQDSGSTHLPSKRAPEGLAGGCGPHPSPSGPQHIGAPGLHAVAGHLWHLLFFFPGAERLCVVQDKLPLLPGQPLVLGRPLTCSPKEEKEGRCWGGGWKLLCQVLCPPGSHSGDARRSRTIAEPATCLAWDGALTTFVPSA